MNKEVVKADSEARKARAREYNLKNWWKHLLGGLALWIVGGIIYSLSSNGLLMLTGSILAIAGVIGVIAGIVNGIRVLIRKK